MKRSGSICWSNRACSSIYEEDVSYLYTSAADTHRPILATAKPVPIPLVISRPNHRPIYQPTAHLSHITAVNHCILRPLTPADRQPNACGTADRGGGCTWQVLLQIYIDS